MLSCLLLLFLMRVTGVKETTQPPTTNRGNPTTKCGGDGRGQAPADGSGRRRADKREGKRGRKGKEGKGGGTERAEGGEGRTATGKG